MRSLLLKPVFAQLWLLCQLSCWAGDVNLLGGGDQGWMQLNYGTNVIRLCEAPETLQHFVL